MENQLINEDETPARIDVSLLIPEGDLHRLIIFFVNHPWPIQVVYGGARLLAWPGTVYSVAPPDLQIPESSRTLLCDLQPRLLRLCRDPLADLVYLQAPYFKAHANIGLQLHPDGTLWITATARDYEASVAALRSCRWFPSGRWRPLFTPTQKS